MYFTVANSSDNFIANSCICEDRLCREIVSTWMIHANHKLYYYWQGIRRKGKMEEYIFQEIGNPSDNFIALRTRVYTKIGHRLCREIERCGDMDCTCES